MVLFSGCSGTKLGPHFSVEYVQLLEQLTVFHLQLIVLLSQLGKNVRLCAPRCCNAGRRSGTLSIIFSRSASVVAMAVVFLCTLTQQSCNLLDVLKLCDLGQLTFPF